MHSAIAILAVGLVVACAAALTYLYRHHKLSQSAVGQEGRQAPRE